MKLNFALLLISLAIFCLAVSTHAKDDDEKDEKKDTIFSRLLQRRVDRLRKLLDILQDREKSLSGKLRDAIKDRIQRVRDRLNKLLGRDKKKDDDELAIKDDDDDEDKKDSFLTRRINRLREVIKSIEKRLGVDTLSEKARELINVRIDVLRAIVDRLLKRDQKDKMLL